MTKETSVKLREDYRQKLIGTSFDKKNGWDIKEVIISNNNIKDAANIYTCMYDNNVSNDMALRILKYVPEKYNVFVISNQWPWGSGDLLIDALEAYLKSNPF